MTTGLDNAPAPCNNGSTPPGCLLECAPPATHWAYRTLQDVLTQASGTTNITIYTSQRLGVHISMTAL